MFTRREYESIFSARPKIDPLDFLNAQICKLSTLGLVSLEEAGHAHSLVPRDKFSLWMPKKVTPDEFQKLMGLVKYHDINRWLCPQPGVSSITERSSHSDLALQPDGPYFCVGIEDGRARRGATTVAISRTIRAENRIPYVTANAIFHALSFPMALAHHGMQIVGSRCNLTGVPGLRLRYGMPVLDLPNRLQGDVDKNNPEPTSDFDLAWDDHGAPSYEEMMPL